MQSDTNEVTLPDPAFVIEYGGKLYLTLGVLEYDPEQGDLTDEQKRTIEKLKGHLGKGGGGRAAPVYEWHMYAGGITRPPTPTPL